MTKLQNNRASLSPNRSLPPPPHRLVASFARCGRSPRREIGGEAAARGVARERTFETLTWRCVYVCVCVCTSMAPRAQKMQRPEKTASIRTRVAPNHASYVRHASKILGRIKNACFRLVCRPSRTPLIYIRAWLSRVEAPTRAATLSHANTHTYKCERARRMASARIRI